MGCRGVPLMISSTGDLLSMLLVIWVELSVQMASGLLYS